MKIEITAYTGNDKIKAYIKITIDNLIHLNYIQVRENNGVEYVSLPSFEYKNKHKYYFELTKEIKEVLLKSYKIGEKVIVFVNEGEEKRDEKNLQKLCI